MGIRRVVMGVSALAVAGALIAIAPRARVERRVHERERDDAPVAEAFWAWRVSYPTGRFDPAWYAAAAKAGARLPHGVPDAGRARAKGASGVLDPSRATALGPSPLNWSTQYGDVAGRVNALLAHPTRMNVAWFASDGGGVWKTTNCCGVDTTWRVTTDAPGIDGAAISTLAMDPNDPDTIYAGTGDALRNRPFAFGAAGVLKSTDGGETWRVLASDVFDAVYDQPAGAYPQRRSIGAIAVDPRASNRIAVGTSQGLYFSADAGATWAGPCFTNPFTDQRQDVTALIAVADGASTRLIAAVGAIASRSSVRFDLGRNGANGVYDTTMPASGCPASWRVISRPDNGWPARTASGVPKASGGNPLSRIDLAIAPSDPRVIYAQAAALGVWRSDDAGATWREVAAFPDSFTRGCRDDSTSGVGFQDYNAGLIVSPTNPQLVFLSSIDVWRSPDGGNTFTNLTCGYDRLPAGAEGYVHVDHHARAFVGGDDQRLLVGNDGGVYATANARATAPDFLAINGGTNTIEFYSGDLTAGFDDRAVPARAIAAGAQDNGSAVQVWNAGETPGLARWRVAFGGDGVYPKIEPMLGRRWYFEAQGGYIEATASGPDVEPTLDVSPSNPLTGEPWNGDRVGFLMPYELYKFGDESTCPAASGCQRMIAGTHRAWESLSGGLPSDSWYPSSPDLTKALSNDSNLSILNNVHFAYRDASIAYAGSNDGNVSVGFDLGGGRDAPATWIDVTGGNAVLPNRPVMDVAGDPGTPTIAYAALAGFDANTPATPGHVYRLACAARCASFAWENRSGDLPDVPVNAILANPNVPRQVFAGTDIGLYYTDDITVASPRWTRFDGGLPSAMVWGLTIDRGATTLAIFTRSRGAYVWPLPKAVAVDLDRRALGGSWYDAANPGQGFAIEVYPDLGGAGRGLLFAGWFTYDASAAGGKRWYALSGDAVRGAASAALDVYAPVAGNFDAAPAIPAGAPVGRATIAFADCGHARLSYSIGARAGEIALSRLTPDESCASSATPGASSFFSGSWYDAALGGQGLLFDFSPSTRGVFAAWYTFAADGARTGGGASQRWYTLQSDRFDAGATSLADIPIYETSGGVFDHASPTTTAQVGVATLTLRGCSAMSLSYRFTSGELAGRTRTIELTRTGPAPAGCAL